MGNPNPQQLKVTEGASNNDTVPTLGKVEDMIGVENTWNRDVVGTPFLKPANAGDPVGATGTRISKGWFTDLEITNMPTVSGTSINANAVLDLTSAEVSQLANIHTETIQTTEWAILADANQGIATTNSVAFVQVSTDKIIGKTLSTSIDIDKLTFVTTTAGFTTISSSDITNVLTLAGGTSSAILRLDRGATNQNGDLEFQTASVTKWTAGLIANEIDDDYHLQGAGLWFTLNQAAGEAYFPAVYADTISTATKVLSIDSAGQIGISTTSTPTFAQVTVDNLVLNGNTLSSTSGNINITPDNAADDIILNGHWSFDGKTLVAISDSDTTFTAYAGKNIAIEGVTFDGGLLTADQVTVDSIVLNAATIEITANTDYALDCKRISPGDGNDLIVNAADGINAGAGADGGDIILSSGVGVAGGVDGDIYLQTGGATKVTITPTYLSTTGYINQAGISAEIYVADASAAQSIATGAGYTKSTAFTTDGQSSNCTSNAANNKITLTQLGKYTVTASVSATSGTAAVTFRGTTFLNGVEQDQCHFKRKYQTASDSGSASFSGDIDVTSVPWDLDFRLRHDNGGAVNYTIEYANLHVKYWGAT